MLPVFRQLRRDEHTRPDHFPIGGVPLLGRQIERQPEIRDPHVMANSREQNVTRLHIPMDNFVIVRVIQGPRDLQRHLHYAFKLVLVQRQPAVEITMFATGMTRKL